MRLSFEGFSHLEDHMLIRHISVKKNTSQVLAFSLHVDVCQHVPQKQKKSIYTD